MSFASASRRKSFGSALTVAAVFVFACLPFLLGHLAGSSAPYWLDVLNTVGLYAILALSLNIILGHAGLFHMGHAAFFAVGAYVSAILNLTFDWPIMATIPAAALAAGLLAGLVAWPVVHLSGDYLLIVTIGIVEIVRIALTNDIFGLTGGPNGLVGISRPEIMGFRLTRPQHFFYLIWGLVAVSVLLFDWLERSRFGRALKYIREDVVAAESMGVNTNKYKILAFVIGAAWAGLAGTVYASRMRTISPESFNFTESVFLFIIVILGGRGNQKGVLLGSFLVMGLPEIFRGFENKRLLVFGAALVIMMIFRPGGLLPARSPGYKLPEPYRSRYKRLPDLSSGGVFNGAGSRANGPNASASEGFASGQAAAPSSGSGESSDSSKVISVDVGQDLVK
ncbi:MAG: branched-chain amino acid ABC transporter permease [Deltaproteobacteria bacterium]|jgi:branched-chain amino acid transport system permease protein|nr:branched-chain amino acid ABC transporter permease [Deltaproteobacteria bacterium]